MIVSLTMNPSTRRIPISNTLPAKEAGVALLRVENGGALPHLSRSPIHGSVKCVIRRTARSEVIWSDRTTSKHENSQQDK